MCQSNPSEPKIVQVSASTLHGGYRTTNIVGLLDNGDVIYINTDAKEWFPLPRPQFDQDGQLIRGGK